MTTREIDSSKLANIEATSNLKTFILGVYNKNAIGLYITILIFIVTSILNILTM